MTTPPPDAPREAWDGRPPPGTEDAVGHLLRLDGGPPRVAEWREADRQWAILFHNHRAAQIMRRDGWSYIAPLYPRLPQPAPEAVDAGARERVAIAIGKARGAELDGFCGATDASRCRAEHPDCECMRDADAALAALRDAGTGEMVCVPREPTPRMLEAAFQQAVATLSDPNDHCKDDRDRSAHAIRPLWTAMIAAATTPPGPGAKGGSE